MRKLILIAAAVLMFTVACNVQRADALLGNLNAGVNCDVLKNVLADQGVLAGGRNQWVTWEAANYSIVQTHAYKHNCRWLTLTWGGWWAEGGVFDRDAVVGGDNTWEWTATTFYPVSQSRPHLVVTAYVCNGDDVFPVSGQGCP